jgi:hypothetical protein
LVRALKAASAAGLQVRSYRVDPQTGAIDVVTDDGPAQDSNANPLDNWIAKRARQA